MSTNNFNIFNEPFALNNEKAENFYLENQDLLQENSKLSTMSFPVYTIKKFKTVEVIYCPAYYEGATLDYDCFEIDNYDLDLFFKYDVQGYLDYNEKTINQLNKQTLLELIRDYIFDGFLDIEQFKNITFRNKDKKQFVQEVVNKAISKDKKEALKYLKDLAKQYKAIAINKIGSFNNGEAIYSTK